jgi:hypothetical protein
MPHSQLQLVEIEVQSGVVFLIFALVPDLKGNFHLPPAISTPEKYARTTKIRLQG